MSIREAYIDNGVDEYYIKKGDSYRNPHEPIIQNHLKGIIDLDFINQENSILDLCCGSGEVSSFISSLGFNKITGSDPYTINNYSKRTSFNCLPYSFKDISKGKIQQNFDVIICSFALHLAPVSLLPIILYNLSMISNKLIIISPHKKPEIKDFWELTFTSYQDKVYLKIYEKITI